MMRATQRLARTSTSLACAFTVLVPVSLVGVSLPAAAQSLPPIRTTARNQVPACVTPARLMRFTVDRNPQMLAKFRHIAVHYKEHGKRLGIRWDYAFFQMLLETNYLKFRNNSGRGDVRTTQNNFAGIGTTGGGVPGDNFPDVSTGVLAQMQHLVAYSGERVENPVARRTREQQDHIISLTKRRNRGRPMTFRDLSGRWAVDRRYYRSMAAIAGRYAKRFCSGQLREPEPTLPSMPDEVASQSRTPKAPAAFAAASASAPPAVRKPIGLLGAPELAVRPPMACKVFTASYGGQRNVLIRRQVGREWHYTALQVLDGQEKYLVDAFIQNHAEGGQNLGRHPDRQAALRHAFELCPSAAASAR